MIRIIRGTTPTITYTFKTITTSEITAAYLTIKQRDTVVVEKDIASAAIGNKDISWTLTQADTLLLATHTDAGIMINWKLVDGTRGASEEKRITPVDNHLIEVI